MWWLDDEDEEKGATEYIDLTEDRTGRHGRNDKERERERERESVCVCVSVNRDN